MAKTKKVNKKGGNMIAELSKLAVPLSLMAARSLIKNKDLKKTGKDTVKTVEDISKGTINFGKSLSKRTLKFAKDIGKNTVKLTKKHYNRLKLAIHEKIEGIIDMVVSHNKIIIKFYLIFH